MAKGRDNAAESLGDVLDLIRTRRQSGLLSVERMQAGRFEEGEIFFQNGQPVFATSGQMSGQEALVWLLSWHPVYYTFASEAPRSAANIPATNTSNESMAAPANISSVSASVRRPLATSTPLVMHANRPSVPNTPATPPRISNVTPPGGLQEGETRKPAYAQNPSIGSSSTPGLEWLVPQKLGKDRDVLSLPLTRPQRSIYLLIDGRRTVADLSRCTRKSMQEIERLLSELQERRLITI